MNQEKVETDLREFCEKSGHLGWFQIKADLNIQDITMCTLYLTKCYIVNDFIIFVVFIPTHNALSNK